MRERIVVAMSGGVDSAVAAARLVQRGCEVVGVTLHLWDYPDKPDGKGRCCAPEDQYDAKRTADALGFPHYTFDRRALFESSVVAPFVEAYVAGTTPAPCSSCNRTVKLAELFRIADRLGARQVATGHYADVGMDERGDPFLLRGADENKDQSYFLYATPREQLLRLCFPLGESTKAEVRREAETRNLPGWAKGESQELCFVGAGGGAYKDFVLARAKGRVRPGNILNERGEVLGAHPGLYAFTVGQKKGLGILTDGKTYVTGMDPGTGALYVGSGDALLCAEATLEDVVLAPGVSLPRNAIVRTRYRHEGAPADVRFAPNGRASVKFHAPLRAVSHGQIAVFYEGRRVLGGGRIVDTKRAEN